MAYECNPDMGQDDGPNQDELTGVYEDGEWDEQDYDDEDYGGTYDPYYGNDEDEYGDDALDYDEPDYDPDDYAWTWRDRVRSWWWKVRHPQMEWQWWWYSFRVTHGLTRCNCGKLKRFGDHSDCIPF